MSLVLGQGLIFNGFGGGGSDPHNLGWYVDLNALETAHPVGTSGDYAILGSTDTVWVWDEDTIAWVDTDTKGQVTTVNNQTGDVVVQETLVSGTNIKTINGSNVLGSGNLEIASYLNFPSSWPTTSATTTKAFCDVVAGDSTAIEGKMYLGEVRWNDLPAEMVNAEVTVKIMKGSSASNKVILLEMTSGNRAPYKWQYTYWNQGGSVSGWIGFQPELPSQTGQSGKYLTTNGSSMSWSTVDALPSQSGQSGKYLTTDGTTASWTEVDALPAQTSQLGKFLTTNGTAASWSGLALSNISDVTATTSEVNKLHGVTVTTNEINYLDGVSSNIQNQLTNKVVFRKWTTTPNN